MAEAAGAKLIYSGDCFQLQLETRIVYRSGQRPQILGCRSTVLNDSSERLDSAPAQIPLKSLRVFICPQNQLAVEVHGSLEPALQKHQM
jgi:hypothetical protein